eukprot:sb/3474933/
MLTRSVRISHWAQIGQEMAELWPKTWFCTYFFSQIWLTFTAYLNISLSIYFSPSLSLFSLSLFSLFLFLPITTQNLYVSYRKNLLSLVPVQDICSQKASFPSSDPKFIPLHIPLHKSGANFAGATPKFVWL